MSILEHYFPELIQCVATMHLVLALVVALVKAPLTETYRPYRKAKRWLAAAYVALSANLFAWCYFTEGRWDVFNYTMECVDIILFYVEDILLCYAFFTLLNKDYVTWRRIVLDVAAWALAVVLSVVALADALQPWRDLLLLLASCLLLAFIIRFLFTFARQYHANVRKLENYFSSDMQPFIRWTGTSIVLMAVSWLLAILSMFQGIEFNWLFQFYVVALYVYIAVSFINYAYPFASLSKAFDEVPAAGGVALSGLEQRLQVWAADKHYLAQQFTIDDLASRLGTNTSYLSCLINEKYGMNFSAWVSSLRIAEAKRLMQQSPDMKLESIAYKVGFSSASYFSKVFSMQEGLSPAAWRKEQQ